jgi:predicted nuclease with TOPRIM domain
MAELSSNSKNMLFLEQQSQQLQQVITMVPLIVTELKSLNSKVTTLQEENPRIGERVDILEEQVARLQEENTTLEERVARLEERFDKYISEEQFKKINFTHSEILKCKVRNSNRDLISDNLTYNRICRDIWKTTSKRQNKNANNTILEILKFVKIQGYTIKICIQLKDSDKNPIKKIYYKNYP